MKRRDFLKRTLGIATGVVALPSIVRVQPRGLTTADFEKVKKYFDETKHNQPDIWIASKEDLSALTSGNCKYMPRREFKEHPERVPYNTTIYPSFNETHKLMGFYWNTEEKLGARR